MYSIGICSCLLPTSRPHPIIVSQKLKKTKNMWKFITLKDNGKILFVQKMMFRSWPGLEIGQKNGWNVSREITNNIPKNDKNSSLSQSKLRRLGRSHQWKLQIVYFMDLQFLSEPFKNLLWISYFISYYNELL